MADLNVDLLQFDEAERCVRQRIALAQQHNNQRLEAAGWRQMAAVYQAAGRSAEEIRAIQTANSLGVGPSDR